MSHFSTIQVQIKQGDVLLKTLQQLGYSVARNTQVRGYRGNKTTAEFVVQRSNGYDIGFRLNGDLFEMVADFWGVDLDAKQFAQQVTQAYAHHVLLDNVQQQGFDVIEEQSLVDGTIRVVVGKWV